MPNAQSGLLRLAAGPAAGKEMRHFDAPFFHVVEWIKLPWGVTQ